jgi:hypothetical protein
MRKRKGPRCWYCLGNVDVKVQDYVLTTQVTWYRYKKQYWYHENCWTEKRDRENMRKYRERLEVS